MSIGRATPQEHEASTAGPLSVSTQPAGSRIGRLTPLSSVARAGVRLGELIGRRGFVLGCVCYLGLAALVLAVPAYWPAVGNGVVTDQDGTVTFVDSKSLAWHDGLRIGWQQGAFSGPVAAVSADDSAAMPSLADPSVEAILYVSPDGSSEIWVASHPADLATRLSVLLPAVGLCLGAGGLWLLRLRRSSRYALAASTLLSSPIFLSWCPGPVSALAILPAAFGLGFARYGYRSLVWPDTGSKTTEPWPWTAGSLVAIVAAILAGTWYRSLTIGLVWAVGVAGVLTWLALLHSRIAVAGADPETRPWRSRLRAVTLDMVPFARPVAERSARTEREKLASDLHAEVLPAIASTAADLERRGATAEAETLRSLAGSVRDLVSARRLPVLEDRGLVEAAEWLAESIEDRTPLRVEIEVHGDAPRRPRTVERAAYRVLQLALDNVIRHAEASTVRVSIGGDAHSLELSIADDGRGIGDRKSTTSSPKGHLGLSDMFAETESIGGRLELGPNSPEGTLVVMRWPG